MKYVDSFIIFLARGNRNDIPVSQRNPSNPSGQSQVNPPSVFVHIPPNMHGFASHSLTSEGVKNTRT